LEVGITYNRMLCNDFTGPARFRLNMPEVALELKRVWHPWYRLGENAQRPRSNMRVEQTYWKPSMRSLQVPSVKQWQLLSIYEYKFYLHWSTRCRPNVWNWRNPKRL